MTSEVSLGRREFLRVAGGAAALSAVAGNGWSEDTPAEAIPIAPPQEGFIEVAFALSGRANVIDVAGSWEVFQDAMLHPDGKMRHPFRLRTVAETKRPIRMTGGLQVVPDFDFSDCPRPHVIVVPAQAGSTTLHEWLRTSSATADVTMSVCTGAFQLGAAGLLNELSATTHHDAYDTFAKQFPDVTLVRNQRFVDNGRIATAGGLTSGIDLALHIVSRYFGAAVSEQTARYMEHDHYEAGSGVVVG